MYESPIQLITQEITHNLVAERDKQIYEAVCKTGVIVDKEELIKALQYDRGQYEKGYFNAITDFSYELKRGLPTWLHPYVDALKERMRG